MRTPPAPPAGEPPIARPAPRILFAGRDALPRIAQIDRHGFAPWPIDVFRRWHGTVGSAVRMATLWDEVFPRVAGFAVFMAQARGIELMRLGVDPHDRRRGIGLALLADAANYAVKHPRRRLFAHIPDAALDVHLLLRRAGWRSVNILRGAASNGGDLYRFELRCRP